jgi:hypothetical protein
MASSRNPGKTRRAREIRIQQRHVAGELLPDGQRGGVLQMGAAIFCAVELARQEARNSSARGRSATSVAAAIGSRGKVSFEDCDILTSSLGWTGFAAHLASANSIARLEMTSLAFMLVWVPLPVCQTATEVHQQTANDIVGGLNDQFTPPREACPSLG